MRKKSAAFAALGAVMGLQLAFGPMVYGAAGADEASASLSFEGATAAQGDAAITSTSGVVGESAAYSGAESSSALEPTQVDDANSVVETTYVSEPVTSYDGDYKYYDLGRGVCFINGVFYWPCWGTGGEGQTSTTSESTPESSVDDSADPTVEESSPAEPTAIETEQAPSGEPTASETTSLEVSATDEPTPSASASEEPTVEQPTTSEETATPTPDSDVTTTSSAPVTFEEDLSITGNRDGNQLEWNVVIPAPSQDVSNTVLEITRVGGNWGFDKEAIANYDFGPGVTVISVKRDKLVLSIDNLAAGQSRTISVPGADRGNDGKTAEAEVAINGDQGSFALSGRYGIGEGATSEPATSETSEPETSQPETSEPVAATTEATLEPSTAPSTEHTTEQTTEVTSVQTSEPRPSEPTSEESTAEPTPTVGTTTAQPSTEQPTTESSTTQESTSQETTSDESSAQAPTSEQSSPGLMTASETGATSERSTNSEVTTASTTSERATDGATTEQSDRTPATRATRANTAVTPSVHQAVPAAQVPAAAATAPVAPAAQSLNTTAGAQAAPAQSQNQPAQAGSGESDSSADTAENAKADTPVEVPAADDNATAIAASQPAPEDLAEIHSIREANQGPTGIPPVDMALNVVAFTVLVGGAAALYRLLKP